MTDKDVTMENNTEYESRMVAKDVRKRGASAPEHLRVTRKGGHIQGKQKHAAVQRLLHGEDILTLSDELGVTVGRILYWKKIYGQDGAAQNGLSDDDELVRLLRRELELLRRKNEELRSELRRWGCTPQV